MTRWSPDAALRLEEAAMSLFAEQGYASTTVPQIAARAELTTRTFFRHFADKRDVLFLRDREFPDVVRAVLDGLPDDLAGMTLVRTGLRRAGAEIERWRDPIARRQRIIGGEEQLRERELLKHEHLSNAVRAALVERGVEARQAEALARVSAVVFDTAVQRWIDADPDTSLTDELDIAWGDLDRLFG
ncbi:TetR family transcriptional regulator [Labedella gwakjiensis]|nr:TetR/AcrR family transcriptional regulator [Labedella gwakjiensis]PSL37645.1 TetR family transcriptional regulator [Labedella gwakjiensis]